MSIQRLGGVLALLGGVTWLAATLLGTQAPAWDALRWSGLGLVLAGFVCTGLTLVKGHTRWLDVVVGAAFPLLAWTIYEVLGDAFSSARLLHGALGVLFVLIGAGVVARGGEPRDPDAVVESSHVPSHRA